MAGENFVPDLWRRTHTSQRVDRHDTDVKELVDSQTVIGDGLQTLAGGVISGVTPSGRQPPGTSQLLPVPSGSLPGAFQPWGLWSDGVNGWVTNRGRDATIHGVDIFSQPIVYNSERNVHLTGEPQATSSRRGLIRLPSNEWIVATNTGVHQYSPTGAFIRTVSSSTQVQDLAFVRNASITSTSVPGDGNFTGDLILGTNQSEGVTAWGVLEGNTRWTDMGYAVSSIGFSSNWGLAINGSNLWISQSNTWWGHVLPNVWNNNRRGSHAMARKESITRVISIPSGYTALTLRSGWASGNFIYAIAEAPTDTSPPETRYLILRNVVAGLATPDETIQDITWSSVDYDAANNRYEYTHDKNQEHPIARTSFGIFAAAYLRGTEEPGGDVDLTFSGTSIGELRRPRGFSRWYLVITTDADTPVGEYNGTFTARAAAKGEAAAVTSTRNVRINVIDSSVPGAVRPLVFYPPSYTFTAYGRTLRSAPANNRYLGTIWFTGARVSETIPADRQSFRVSFTTPPDSGISLAVDFTHPALLPAPRRYYPWYFDLYSLFNANVPAGSYDVTVLVQHYHLPAGERDDDSPEASGTFNLRLNVLDEAYTGPGRQGYQRTLSNRPNPNWGVETDKNVLVNTSESINLTNAFVEPATQSGGPTIYWDVEVGSASTDLVQSTRISNTAGNIVERLRYLAVGPATISIGGYNGTSWTWFDIRRNILNRRLDVSGSGWYIRRSGETNAVKLNDLTVNVAENSVRSEIEPTSEIYFAYQGSDVRSINDGKPGILAYNVDDTSALAIITSGIHDFTTASGTLTGLRVRFFTIGSNLNHEELNQVRYRIEASVPAYTSGTTEYAYYADSFYLTLNVTNVNDPPMWTDGWVFPGLAADGKLHLPGDSGPHTYSTDTWASDEDSAASNLILRTSVNTGSNLSASWARASTPSARIPGRSEGTLSLTAGNQQLTETTLQLIWFDGTSNSVARRVPVVIGAPTRITPTGSQFTSSSPAWTVAENTASGTTLGTLNFYFNSDNLQAVFGDVTLSVTGDAADYISVYSDVIRGNVPGQVTIGDDNTANRIRTTYQITVRLGDSPNFETYGSAAKSFSIRASAAGSPNTIPVSINLSGTLAVTNTIELVKRNSVTVPDHTFTIDAAYAGGGTAPMFEIDPTLYFVDEDPDPSRPVTYEVDWVSSPSERQGLFTIRSSGTTTAPRFIIEPNAIINGSQRRQQYKIVAHQNNAPQATGFGTIIINPFAPRPLRSRYFSPSSQVSSQGRAYIDATAQSTRMDISAVITNPDNRPLQVGWGPTYLQQWSDVLATYVVSTLANGNIVVTATRADTYTPQTETSTSNLPIRVRTTDVANQSEVFSNWILEVTRPSS